MSKQEVHPASQHIYYCIRRFLNPDFLERKVGYGSLPTWIGGY